LRLTQIKLAGFKSFVDPTAIATPGQLVGIVGPNGCGSPPSPTPGAMLGEFTSLRARRVDDVIQRRGRPQVGRLRVGRAVFDNSLGCIAVSGATTPS
jgi:chromosome segregation protein